MNANEIHPAIVQGIYKQAADDILSKIKAALGIEEKTPAIDEVSGALTAGAVIPGAVRGAKGGIAVGKKLNSKLLDYMTKQYAAQQLAHSNMSAVEARAAAGKPMTGDTGLFDYAAGRFAASGKNAERAGKAAKLFRNKRLMGGIGGVGGGLLSAGAVYALTNPRSRAAIARALGVDKKYI